VTRPAEVEGEETLLKSAIRIDPKTPRDKLDPLSRLNYAKIYTVEYNVKVCFVGNIHENSVKYFVRDFNHTHAPLPQNPNTEYSDEEGRGESRGGLSGITQFENAQYGGNQRRN
jgi:hypothetical protein